MTSVRATYTNMEPEMFLKGEIFSHQVKMLKLKLVRHYVFIHGKNGKSAKIAITSFKNISDACHPC